MAALSRLVPAELGRTGSSGQERCRPSTAAWLTRTGHVRTGRVDRRSRRRSASFGEVVRLVLEMPAWDHRRVRGELARLVTAWAPEPSGGSSVRPGLARRRDALPGGRGRLRRPAVPGVDARKDNDLVRNVRAGEGPCCGDGGRETVYLEEVALGARPHLPVERNARWARSSGSPSSTPSSISPGFDAESDANKIAKQDPGVTVMRKVMIPARSTLPWADAFRAWRRLSVEPGMTDCILMQQSCCRLRLQLPR